MPELKALTTFDAAAAQRIITGYSAVSKFHAVYEHTQQHVKIELHLQSLPIPYQKTYDPLDAATIAHYNIVVQKGWSLGAFEGHMLLALALAEHQTWNNTLWVWEFHVAQSHRGQGIGRRLMEVLIERSQKEGIRAIVCETQNTNVFAIQFYQRMGFRIEGIDLSYYTNTDYPDGEIALFLKRYLP